VGTNHCACESEGKAGEHVIVAMHAQKRQALDGEKEQHDEDAKGAGGDRGKDEEDFTTAPRESHGMKTRKKAFEGTDRPEN
jgi:hypothetical protein